MKGIKRQAVIIGSPGDHKMWLRGVSTDFEQFSRFLQSANGGGFFDYEIIKLWDPTYELFISTIKGIEADYMLIYYSGHGCMKDDQKQMIKLKDALVSETELYGVCRKTLMIFDACRNKTRGARISGIPWAIEECLNFAGISQVRQIFDRAIAESPRGITVLYATGDGCVAYDDQDGGDFTQAIFRSVIDAQLRHEDGFISTEKVVTHAAWILAENYDRNQRQVPQMIWREGNLTIPFAYVSPKLVFQQQSPPPIVRQPGNTKGVLYLAAGLLIADYLLSE